MRLLEVENLRSHLAAIVDSSDDAIISKDLNGVISTWNVAAQRLFGYSEAESVGRSITLIIPPELRNEEEAILASIRRGERIQHFETQRTAKDGRILDVSITISPVRDTIGTIVGASKILRDITEQKRARVALKESERRAAREAADARILQSISTRLISESHPESLFGQILDAAMVLMRSHAASVQLLAPDGQSLALLAWHNFHPDSAAFWRRVTSDAGSTCGVALRDNARVLVTDVDACQFMAGTQDLEEYRRSNLRAVQSTPLRSRTGRPLGMISTHWRVPHHPTDDDFRLFDVLARQAADLIERTHAEEALRESEDRFRRIANTAPVIIWVSDLEHRCTYVNQAWFELTGQSSDTSPLNAWTDRVHPADATRCRDTYTNAFDRREPFQIGFRLRRHDGDYRWIDCTGVPRFYGEGSFAGYIGSAVDVTERRLADEALATINQQLIDAHEEERSRIARELHDDIGQRLVVVGLGLEALARAGDSTEIKQKASAALEEVMNLSKDVQALSHRLHPARLELLGLAAASAAFCREVSNRSGLEINFDADRIPEELSKHAASCLYRVLQEALQNAIKHSGVRQIDVTLRGGDDEIQLEVRDAGLGFQRSPASARGLGLTSMRERVEAVHGRLFILSESQRGTTVLATVPMPKNSQGFTVG